MTGATVCSGIGAPETAMPWVDWKWCAEVEKFPSSVLAARHPQSVNLSDITAPDFIGRAVAFGRPLDLLVAGTPCQAFSVAGNRESLGDARGNLTLRFVEIVDAINPRTVLWENVPGVLSTKDNAFGCFLAALVGADAPIVPVAGWTNAGMVSGPRRNAAWRILDAQYFGLAQRRRRVFVVACPRNGADPREILFEHAGVRRHTPTRGEAGEGVTGTLSARASGGDGLGTDFDLGGGYELSPALTSSGRGVERTGETRGQDCVVPVALRGHSDYGDGLPCLRGDSGDCCGGSEALVTHSLRGEGFDASEDGTGRGIPLVAALAMRGRDGVLQIEMGDDVANAILTPNGGRGGIGVGAVMNGMAVRRLTPRECERLQGFPDDFTALDKAADGPRYKALGNSMAVPVIRWIGRRIAATGPAAPEEPRS